MTAAGTRTGHQLVCGGGRPSARRMILTWASTAASAARWRLSNDRSPLTEDDLACRPASAARRWLAWTRARAVTAIRGGNGILLRSRSKRFVPCAFLAGRDGPASGRHFPPIWAEDLQLTLTCTCMSRPHDCRRSKAPSAKPAHRAPTSRNCPGIVPSRAPEARGLYHRAQRLVQHTRAREGPGDSAGDLLAITAGGGTCQASRFPCLRHPAGSPPPAPVPATRAPRLHAHRPAGADTVRSGKGAVRGSSFALGRPIISAGLTGTAPSLQGGIHHQGTVCRRGAQSGRCAAWPGRG
jgi:hypothetical protein